jgi:hypothetical protein
MSGRRGRVVSGVLGSASEEEEGSVPAVARRRRSSSALRRSIDSRIPGLRELKVLAELDVAVVEVVVIEDAMGARVGTVLAALEDARLNWSTSRPSSSARKLSTDGVERCVGRGVVARRASSSAKLSSDVLRESCKTPHSICCSI